MFNRKYLRSASGRLVATAAIGMFSFLGGSGALRADVINVVNPGFEDINGESPNNEFTFGPLNGWDLYDPGGITGGGTGGQFFIGTLMPSPPTNFDAGTFEGDRVGIAFNRAATGGDGEYGMQQTLVETLAANMTYTLDVDIGNIRSGTALSGSFFNLEGLPGYRVDLLAGGVVIAQDLNTLAGSIGEGDFETSSITFHSGASPAQLGQTLGIRLVNLNVVDTTSALSTAADLEVDFDNVQFSRVTSVPEPGSLAIIGLCGVVLLRRRRTA